MISSTPKKGSECHQIAPASQKPPATTKHPTFTHLANFQFTSSSRIPIIGRITSKTNSKHNWKSNAGNPTLRSLVNIAQATKVLAAITQAPRKILFSTLEERPTPTNDKGSSLFICRSSRYRTRLRLSFAGRDGRADELESQEKRYRGKGKISHGYGFVAHRDDSETHEAHQSGEGTGSYKERRPTK